MSSRGAKQRSDPLVLVYGRGLLRLLPKPRNDSIRVIGYSLQYLQTDMAMKPLCLPYVQIVSEKWQDNFVGTMIDPIKVKN